MNVAAVQLTAEASPDQNVDRVETRVRTAVDDGADLVVLPEMWDVGYFAFDAYEAAAEPIDGPKMTRLSSLAAELGVYLHTGSVVERDGGDLYNASALFDPDGDRLGVYRKVHLFGYESEEADLLTPGEEVCAVDTDVGTVGLTTCYDLRFPELYRALADEGVDLLLVTSAWPSARLDHWHLFTRTRAVENQCFLVAANLTGTIRDVSLGGQSVVVDPWGVQRANAGAGDRTVHADVDRSEVEAARSEFPALHDRRISLSYALGRGDDE
jgi:predicted amidohydrolase